MTWAGFGIYHCFLANGDCLKDCLKQQIAVIIPCDFNCVQRQDCFKAPFDWENGTKVDKSFLP